MKNIEDKIKSVINNDVQFSNKSKLKQTLLSYCQSDSAFDIKMVSALSSLRLKPQKKALIWNNLFSFASRPSLFSFEKMFEFIKRPALVFSLLFIFLFNLVFQPFTEISTVRALSSVKITTFSGAVTVERNGEILRPTNNFILLESDVVQTGPAGFTEIVFVDGSLVRMSRNSRLNLKQVDNKLVNAQTVLYLQDGELWMNSLGVLDRRSKFVVAAQDLSVIVRDNSIFDVAVAPDYTRVIALDTDLTLSLFDNEKYIPTILKQGELVKVKNSTKLTSYLEKLELKDKLLGLDLDWILSNYKQDEFYIESLSKTRLLELKEIAGTTPDSFFYPIKEARRALQLALTFDPLKQAELSLNFANEKFYEAELMLEKGSVDKAQQALVGYTKNLNHIADKMNGLSDVKSEESQRVVELKENLLASVSIQKKTGVSADLNESKDKMTVMFNQVEKTLAMDDDELDEIIFTQLNDGLFEVKNAIKTGTDVDLLKKMDTYIAEVENVNFNLDKFDPKNELMTFKMLDNYFKAVQMLDDMSLSTAEQKSQNKFKEAMFVVQDGLDTLMEVVQTANLPDEVIGQQFEEKTVLMTEGFVKVTD